MTRCANCLLFAWVLVVGWPAIAADVVVRLPQIGIIIDDLGYNQRQGTDALALPGPVAFSFLPHTPFAHALALKAGESNRDVLLHLPMEAVSGSHGMGPGGLIEAMSRETMLAVFADSLASIPGAVAVNNHMGSLLTANAQAMSWLMEAVTRHGELMFVDSLTTQNSQLASQAALAAVPVLRRDVFLDVDRRHAAIDSQFDRLIRVAHERGWALAIAHPHQETLSVLRRRLSSLSRDGVQLVGLQVLYQTSLQRKSVWHASLSR